MGRGREPRALRAGDRRGLSAAEVVVLLALFVFTVLLVLMLLPRGREQARLTGCQNNLAHVGYALALYDQLEHRLPAIEAIAGLETPRDARPPSTLRTLLEWLEQPDLLAVVDPKTRPERRPGDVPGEMPVRGFICASDPNATSGLLVAPVSYRACTGDEHVGENGAFATGRTMSLREIQERDGMSFTAAFSGGTTGGEQRRRRVGVQLHADFRWAAAGDGMSARVSFDAMGAGMPRSSWISADYRSTLYNHALVPGSQPSCIDSAGKAAFMGASSGHVSGVNLLLMDGRVTVVHRSIDAKIWKEFARIGQRDADSNGE